MKNITLILILALALAFSACQKKTVTPTHQKPVVKIGAILPLSGDYGSLGETIRDAVLWAKEDLDSTKFDYQIFFEDDHLDSKKTATAMQKLTNVDKVDAVISVGDDAGNVVAPIAEKNRIIHFALAFGFDPHMAERKFNFIHWTPPAEEARVLVKALQQKKLKRMAIINFQHTGSKILEAEIIKAIQKTDIQIVSQATVAPGERDFRLTLQKAQRARPDVYFVWLYSPDLEIFTQQFNELNIHEPLTTTEMFSISPTPELFEGRWCVEPIEMPDDQREAFSRKYHQKAMLGVGNAYDIVKMIAYAYENTPSTDPKPSTAAVAETLGKIKNFQGMLGILNMDENGIVQSKAVLKEIRSGKPVLIQGDL